MLHTCLFNQVLILTILAKLHNCNTKQHSTNELHFDSMNIGTQNIVKGYHVSGC